MQHSTKPQSMKEIKEPLQPQTKKSGLQVKDTQNAKLSVVNYLLNDPNLARDLLSPHLDVDNFSRFALSCRASYTLFKPLLPISRAAHYVIVKPSVVEIKKILDQFIDPASLKLFLQKRVANVLGQSGITYDNMTLLQLAYSAGDDEMCLQLEPYFKRAFGSVKAARKEVCEQLNEKFAEGSEEEKAQRTARELEIKNQLQALLKTVIQAITEEPFNRGHDADNKLILSPTTLAAITTFRKALDALQPKVIGKGMAYRYNTLQETFDAYEQAAAQWELHYNRCALFEDGVLVAALLNIPENDAQKLSQGLYYLQKNPPQPLARSLKVRGSENNFYKVLCGASLNFSDLSGSCVDIIWGTCGFSGPVLLSSGRHVKPYVEQKIQTFRTYAAAAILNCSNRRYDLIR